VLVGIGVAQPLVGKSDAPRESDCAVHHENAPVVAMVEHPDHPGFGGMEELDATPGAAQGLDVVLQVPTRGADRVEQDATATPCAACSASASRKRAHLARPEDVGLEVDGLWAEAMAASMAGNTASPFSSRSSGCRGSSSGRAAPTAEKWGRSP
jgi:hypothetical protein